MIIREAQIKELEVAALGSFVIELTEHCKEFSPDLCKTLDQDQLRRAVTQGVDRADIYGLNLRGPVRFYIDLMIVFGSDFDTDPQYPWIAEELAKEEETDQFDRTEAIHTKSQDYLEYVDGPDNVHTLKALEELSVRMRSGIKFQHQNLDRHVLQLFSEVHPRKYERTGEAALRELLDEERTRGQEEYRFEEARSIALMSIMGFAFGHHFHSDPFLPWISRTLDSNDFETPDKKAEDLERRALIWLDAVLKNAKEGK